ncbi:hypothetical protein, partial [Rhodoplanes sp. SY1]|uniref:hypothetical protein n=1 Tax=Rhodoplanes sp. SY1 TaxID=3166646 RepID=UPI0038B52759
NAIALVKILDERDIEIARHRRNDMPRTRRNSHHDKIAKIMFEVICSASRVTTNEFVGWSIQHNTVWSGFFRTNESTARSIILFKLRRMLYNEVKQLKDAPNYLSASVLGYLLNVQGVAVGAKRDFRSAYEYPLRRAVVLWTRKNYVALTHKHPKVAAAVLIGTITYDERGYRLQKTYAEGLSLVAPVDVLDLDHPPIEQA